MNVLAFDTCLGAVSAAVRSRDAHGAWVTHDIYEEMAIGQAERLMPVIGEVMRQAGLHFSDLDRIAVTTGPGSFTGVRVGVAAARGLAVATGLPVVGATSLAVLAHRAVELLPPGGDAAIAVSVDARRGGLYLQLFEADGRTQLSPPEVLTPEEAAQRVGRRRIVAVGSGAALLVGAVAAAGIGSAAPALENLQPHARTLALLAADLLPQPQIKPLYLRQPDAKPQVVS